MIESKRKNENWLGKNTQPILFYYPIFVPQLEQNLAPLVAVPQLGQNLAPAGAELITLIIIGGIGGVALVVVIIVVMKKRS